MEKNWGWIVAGILFLIIILNWNKIKAINKVEESVDSLGRRIGDPVSIERESLDCSKISGLTGTIKLGDQQFYCAGTFQCTPDGSITCVNPVYYYYPYYYPIFRFRRGHHHGGGGPGVGGPGGPGSGTGGGTGGGGQTGTGGGADGGSMQYGGVVYGVNDKIVVPASELDCAKVSGLTGTIQFGDHQFYCNGRFECTPNGSITCRNPQYYYYPYNYYPYYGFVQFPFFRGRIGNHGGGHK